MARKCRQPISMNISRPPCPTVVAVSNPTISPIKDETQFLEFDIEESLWCLNGETVFRVSETRVNELTGEQTTTVTWYDRPLEAGGVQIANPTATDELIAGACCKEDETGGLVVGP